MGAIAYAGSESLCHLGDVIEMLDEGAEGVAVSRDDELLAALDDGHERLHTHKHTQVHTNKHTNTCICNDFRPRITGPSHTAKPAAGACFGQRCFDKGCSHRARLNVTLVSIEIVPSKSILRSCSGVEEEGTWAGGREGGIREGGREAGREGGREDG